jgi:ribonuclease HI
MDPNALNIYTDGSLLPNHNGGYSVRFLFPDSFQENELIKDFDFSGVKNTTIGKMELKACTVALQEVFKLVDTKSIKRIIIYTDSSYVVDNFSKAVYVWPKNGWCATNGKPILNVDLWKDLIREVKRLSSRFRVEIKWVKGHKDNIHNKAVDLLAKQSAQKAKITSLSSKNVVRRKHTNKKTKQGSIISTGQKIKIRVIEAEFLRIQKIYKLRCEVVSPNSKFFGNVDFIFSNEMLRPNHIYNVSLKMSTKYLKINKIIKEISSDKDKIMV